MEWFWIALAVLMAAGAVTVMIVFIRREASGCARCPYRGDCPTVGRAGKQPDRGKNRPPCGRGRPSV